MLAESNISINGYSIADKTKELPNPTDKIVSISDDGSTKFNIISINLFINDKSYRDYENILGIGNINYRDLGIVNDIENATIKFVITDALKTTYEVSYTTNIDVTAPVVELAMDKDRPTSGIFIYNHNGVVKYYMSATTSNQKLVFKANEYIVKSMTSITSSLDITNATDGVISVAVRGYEDTSEILNKYIIDPSKDSYTFTVKVFDEAGNESNEITIEIIVDRSGPEVNYNSSVKLTNGDTVEYNAPFDFENDVHSMEQGTSETKVVLTSGRGARAIIQYAMKDDISGVRKVCLFEGSELTSALEMNCKNNTLDHMYPNGNFDYYTITEGTFILYAIDNVGNAFTHKYVFENKGTGVKSNITKSTNAVSGGSVDLIATVSHDKSEYKLLKWQKPV